jgi:pyruvate formate lyase activating enzyme
MTGGAGPETVGLVARVLRFSAVDGPGNRAVVFLQGCDFNCAYCHNPETRAILPEGSALPAGARLRRMSAAEVVAELRPYRAFLSGVTVSGGECCLQADFLLALVRGFAREGLPTLVDTNGSTDLAALPDLVREAEGFMLDVKAWDSDQHRALVGADNANVRKNLAFLARRGKLAEARTVVAEGSFDAEKTVRETARAMVGAGAGGTAAYKIIAYRPNGVRARFAAGLRQPSGERMDALAAAARDEGVSNVVIV